MAFASPFTPQAVAPAKAGAFGKWGAPAARGPSFRWGDALIFGWWGGASLLAAGAP